MKRKTPAVLLLRAILLLLMSAQPVRAAEASGGRGAITGNVSNLATGNLLEGAKIELPPLGLTAFTDNTGRFILTGVPAGPHEIVASYLGLDSMQRRVAVTAGERTVSNFDLTTGIYKMDVFSVTLNDNIERWRRLYEWRAYTGTATTLPNATTSGVIPGFTDRLTEVRPALSLTLDVANLLNEPQRLYVGNPDRMQSTVINFITLTAGVSGRF